MFACLYVGVFADEQHRQAVNRDAGGGFVRLPLWFLHAGHVRLPQDAIKSIQRP